MPMNAAAYRESLRRYRPRVWVDGERIESVADAPSLQPGINAMGVSYDYALRDDLASVMRALQASSGKSVNRMLQTDSSSADLLNKLEAVRILCQETGCAQRYLAHDAFSALQQSTAGVDAETGSRYAERFLAYLHDFQDKDLALGIAMTDAKGDRSKRPHEQANPDSYVHIVERNGKGIVISGTKAIVTGAPYMHELLVMPCRNMTQADSDYAVCCAVPIDAPGLTLVARPAGRPGEAAATFSGRYGQSTAVALFEDVFVPWARVFLAGEWHSSSAFTYEYATHHRHTCIAARAGFGDLLIGAGALMTEANGIDLDRADNVRDSMVELIRIVEGFYACGVAASVYCRHDAAGVTAPDTIFANVGKLLLATQIYDMHRLAHHVSGGLIVALPGPEEDHNPATGARLSELLKGRSDIPYEKRVEVARLIEDLTASNQGGWYSVISLHGGGSPEAMKMEIWRNYPLGNKVDLVERLLERGVLADATRRILKNRQPGRCCIEGCVVPLPETAELTVHRKKD
jgi:4-hydroxybutyryl-CoA dehydratase/vinylacetyl-CoA-Delta-isomerase